MINHLQRWMGQLKWQRLIPLEKLAAMLLKHLEGIANYCRTKVRFGVVEAVNGNIRMLINRDRGYRNLRYLLLKRRAGRGGAVAAGVRSALGTPSFAGIERAGLTEGSTQELRVGRRGPRRSSCIRRPPTN
jgi:hypothetical protein